MNLADSFHPIRMILTDVDGVLTDGGVILDDMGVETKRFHIRDGLAVRLWQAASGQVGIVTGRTSKVVEQRAAELDVDPVCQGVKDKLSVVRRICDERGLSSAEIAYIGDDLPDLAAIEFAGLGVAVADAAEEIRSAADYVTSVRGGQGALRELVELILKNTRRWDAATRRFAG